MDLGFPAAGWVVHSLFLRFVGSGTGIVAFGASDSLVSVCSWQGTLSLSSGLSWSFHALMCVGLGAGGMPRAGLMI